MAINPLQLPQAPPINSLADWSPLERLVQNWQAQQKEAAQSEDAYRLLGGGQGQPQQGGFLSDLGRKFGILPEAAPVQTAAVPPPRQAGGDAGAGIGTMTPNAKSWFDFAIRPVADGGLGLSQAQAAGKVANLQAESSANITPWGVSGDQGTAQGSAQWRGPRLKNLVEFSRANGMDYRTTEAQQAFMRHEYLGSGDYGGGSESKAYAALSATRSPQEAATAVNRYYERSADKSGRREAGAARLSGSNVPSDTPVIAQGNTPSSAWAARPPLAAALVDPNASPLDNAPYPQGNVGAPPTDVSAQSRMAPPGVAPPLQERAVPPAPVVASDAPEARAVQNLTSGQPAAAAGLDRETLAQMYRNPVTRGLAAAVLQKQMEPGSWSYQQVGDKLIAANSRTGQTKVVMEDTKPLVVGGSIATRDASQPGGYAFHTPPVAEKPLTLGPDDTAYVPTGTPGQYTTLGGGGGNKAQRELAGRTYQADQLGLTGQKREFFLANGKIPTSGEDLSASQLKAVKETEDQIDAGHSALDALERATEVSKKAFQGFGASTLGSIMSNAPSWVPGHEAGVQTRVLENTQLRAALGQLQAAFGRNPSNREDAIMIKLQGSVNEPQEVRKEIFKEAKQVLQERLTKNQRKSEQMRSGEYFKRGGGSLTSDTEAAPAAAPAPAAAAATAKPSLSDFMIKARAANPGVPEGELARFWKQKYGG